MSSPPANPSAPARAAVVRRAPASGAVPALAEVQAPSTIALLQANSLTSAVHAEIERLILAGELPPGSKLTEANLAERLGVSRGPLREAFRMLEEAGLVRQEKNRGVFVRSVPLDEAMEIYELRAMLDEAVCRELAQRIKPEQLKALRSLVEQMERVVREGHDSSASDTYHRLNLGFHDTLVDFVGNRKLSALYRRVVKELSLFRRANLADGHQLPVSASEHRGMLKAIAAGDAEAAGNAARAHVLESKERTFRNQLAAGDAAPAPAAARRTRHA